jgi:hypothetical protein
LAVGDKEDVKDEVKSISIAWSAFATGEAERFRFAPCVGERGVVSEF